MDDPQEGESRNGTDGEGPTASVMSGSAAASPSQAQLSTSLEPSDTAVQKTSPPSRDGLQSQGSTGGSLPAGSIHRLTGNGIDSDSAKTSPRARDASVPSTSTLPVQTGPSIHLLSQTGSSLPVSSSSSSQSLPSNASQLLKGKQKETSVPLSPFGQNDTNNSRADKNDPHTSDTALKAFVRPEAADTQIAAATSDVQASSSMPMQSSWPSLTQNLATTSLDNFSLPSEGLFPSDSSDMADLFGPGSAALFEQLRAAMRESPEATQWGPPPEVPIEAEVSTTVAPESREEGNSDASDSEDEDVDLTFNFDLDAQINAAMASLTESAQATVAGPPQPQEPAPATVATPSEELTVPPAQSEAANPQSVEKEAPAVETRDAPKPHASVDAASDEDEDDDAEATTMAVQFDLDAMLASAMGQGTGVGAQTDSKIVEPARKEQNIPKESAQKAANSSASGDESDDDDAEPAFDLDAHLRQAMALAREQASLSPGEEVIDVGTPLGSATSDESSDDGAGFDLDAHIGQALANQLLASVQQQAPRQPVQAVKSAGKEPSPDFMAHDLQNMLQAAMKQAALELEQEQQEQTTQLEGMTLAAEKQAQAFPDQPAQPPPFVPRRFAMPPKPRTRPRVEDDGDPENAYNRSRQAHPQALHTSYKCDFKGCDKVFARLQAFQTHRQGHQSGKPYKCHLCPATFATNQDFQDHSWTHNRTREWKYRCKGCFNLFGDKGMFDSHVTKARDYRCSRGECELQMRPAGARVTMPPIQPTNEHLSKVNHDTYFTQSGFDQSALLAATLVHQMSSLLARQYDRQTSLLGPSDPKIDANLALRQTFQRAGLTPNEMAALGTILASVGHARNEGLKASLEEARRTQFEAYRKHQERQRKAALKQIKIERKRLKQEAERAAVQEKKKADQAARAEQKKQAEAQKNGDIPVPQAVMT